MTSAEGSAFIHRVGRVLRAHGLSGEILIQLFRPRRLEARQTRWQSAAHPQFVELDSDVGEVRTEELRAAKFLDGSRVVARFGGISDRAQAERIEGWSVDVDPRRRPVLITDEYDELFGAAVYVDDAEEPLAEIVAIRDTGAHPLLVVGEEETLIPAVDAFITGVDRGPDGVKVHVRSIPGLLEANAPKSER